MAKTKRLEGLDDAADIAKLLADPSRLKILSVVAFEGPVSVGGICEAVNLPQPTVSHHLGLLRRSRIVEGKRAGKQVLYTAALDMGKNTGFQALQKLLARLTA